MLGIRHYSPDMHRQIDMRMDGAKFKKKRDDDQGFVDQWGNWLSRAEAFQVAVETDRLAFPKACPPRLDVGPVLYSEGLY